MHLTLKKEATKPAVPNFLQQQARFDKFMDIFNRQRPHEALEMKCPAEIYQPSPRPYTGLPDVWQGMLHVFQANIGNLPRQKLPWLPREHFSPTG
jgi:hypothetical protein